MYANLFSIHWLPASVLDWCCNVGGHDVEVQSRRWVVRRRRRGRESEKRRRRRKRRKEMQNECGSGRLGRKIATHNSPPERPCCYRRSRRRRKAGKTAAVSLVTGGRERGEIMKWKDERKHLAPLRAFTVEDWRKGRGREEPGSHLLPCS